MSMTDPWLVYATEVDAIQGISDIDASFGYPHTGVRAGSGNPAPPAAQKTETWAEARQRATDQQWVFPAPPDEHLPSAGYVVEEYDPAWVLPPSARTGG